MTFLAFEQASPIAQTGIAPLSPLAARKDVHGELKQIATRLSNIRDYIEAGHYAQRTGDTVRILEIATEASNLMPALMRREER